MPWPDDILVLNAKRVVDGVPFTVPSATSGLLEPGDHVEPDLSFPSKVSLTGAPYGRALDGTAAVGEPSDRAGAGRAAAGRGSGFDGRRRQLGRDPGPSGAGKTTLLHALSGLIRPASGRVAWGGLPVLVRDMAVPIGRLAPGLLTGALVLRRFAPCQLVRVMLRRFRGPTRSSSH